MHLQAHDLRDLERWSRVALEANLRFGAAAAPLAPDALGADEAALARALPERRDRSWRTGRAALRAVAAGTTAIQFPHPRASLTYAADIALAVANPDRGATGVGVDLEADRPVKPTMARFYLTDAERAQLDALPAADHQLALLRLWTVKEALFKSDLRNRDRVLRDYEVADVRAGDGTAHAPDGRTFRYASRRLHGAWLSIAIPCETHP